MRVKTVTVLAVHEQVKNFYLATSPRVLFVYIYLNIMGLVLGVVKKSMPAAVASQ